MTRAKNPKKEKRSLPLRSPGESVNTQNARPSQLLFGEVKRLEEIEKQLNDDLEESGRPLVEETAVHEPNTLPSTNLKSGRPQILKVPSTDNSVDGLPSTTPVLPSTKEQEKPHVDGLPAQKKDVAVHKTKNAPSTKNDRHNKNLARYDNRVDPQIKKKIDIFCAKFDLSQREFAEQSAVHFIDLWTAKLDKNVDGKTAHDDLSKMIMWKTKASLVNLYRAYNPENKWKFKDDDAAEKFNLTDLRIIELGIIETQFNSKFKKINSFSYYENEINNFIGQKLGEEMLNFLITHYRQKWNQAIGREVDLSFLNQD